MTDYRHLTRDHQKELLEERIGALEVLHFQLALNIRESIVTGDEHADIVAQKEGVEARLEDLKALIAEMESEGAQNGETA